ncbi:alginate O-acetyltransferase AlgX-related protein [Muricoccus nepalensis]|nr:hypothetical protein [Roseomonas nepalensis]
MAMIAGPSIVVYGNALHRLVSGVPVYSDTALRGVQVPAPKPSLSLDDVLSGQFSRSFVAYFGQHFPLLGPAVRAKAQLYWSVLRQSPAWYITIGRNRTLFETEYIEEYCSRDLVAFTPVAEDWAAKLAEVQRWYAVRGKLFVYLLTPSKAAVEPENLPAGWPCPAGQADREGLHAAYRAILDRAGVNVADSIETTHAAKREYPFPPFPRTGIHFNTVSAARAAQAVIDAVNRASSWRRMDDLSFTWHMAPPNEVDTDLLDALNIPRPGPPVLAPDITVTTPLAPSCHPVLMAQVGGSFAYQVNKAMQRLPCPPRVDLYEYFKNTMAFYPGDTRFPVDPKRRSWMLLDAAEVVVLEENEQIAPRSDHGLAFYELVREQMGVP